ncbi:glycosyltransferase family 4 protein [Candidatus Daviesbacteria bacterium]|nr:glycosyltransferase family 4 protein [Candidatus Daviesbacteria bacterium]
MVIGFDGSRAFVDKKTGTEYYSYQLLKALARIDKNNTYIIYTRATITSTIVTSNVGLPNNFQIKEIRWFRLWTQGGLALQTFKDNLDVLFVPSHTLPVIKKPGLKTVVTVHDLGSEYLPSMHQIKQRLYLGFMQKRQLKTATKIIAVSKATKQDLVRKIHIDEKKISVVYEGYDKEKFKVQSSKFKVSQIIKKYNLIYQNYFLFVGTVQPRKNLERLIEAFSHQSSAFRLIIAGSKGWMSDEIYKLPKKLGIEDRVKFLGYVPDEKLPALYSGAIAFVFPSLFEGFGLPILEAQACGCPVITSNLSSMPEVGGPPAGGAAVYVNPYDIDDIVSGMGRIMNHELRIKLIKIGLENVKRFSWEKCARETLKVLESNT